MEDQKNNKALVSNKNTLIFKSKLYYKKARNIENIALSEEFSKKLIENTHAEFQHIGINQMQNKILPYYTAVNISENIKKFCKNCEVCIKNKSRRHEKIGLMSHLGPARKPFEIISIDTIGGFGGFFWCTIH